ncbi:substrate-binding periplasmic protein [Simiduia curdlanivorans]|uniref:Substrate-binding periplasmic protein n=1 Tax=Simiduia curdlanivorans TaxID=1492769 RepID=A0ABV8V2P8_9GAMM
MVRHLIVYLFVFYLTNSLFASAEPAVSSALIGVPTDVYQDYLLVEPSSFYTRPSYAHPNSRRDVVELFLLQRALVLGGFSQAIEIRPVDGYLRILQQLSEGKITVTGTTVWDFDARESVQDMWVSDAMVRRGEFVVGLYTRERNTAVLQSQTLPELLKLTPVTNRNWKMDWSLLEQMGYRQLQYAGSWDSMVRMVLAGRADFVLAPFPSGPSLNIDAGDGRYLEPIPGVKVAFPAERAFAVSKNTPFSQALFTALQIGLKEMRKSGEIEQAYKDSGFFNAQSQQWLLIYP